VRSATESLLDGLRNRHTPFGEGKYVSRLVRVIAMLGEGGGAVIVGRGSPYILGPERALRVLVVAPREERIERIAKRFDLSRAEAETRLASEERDRRAFLKRLFRVDPDDASLYDLAVNTASFDLDGCAALIEAVLARRSAHAPGLPLQARP
jgi:cytidylate kinase